MNYSDLTSPQTAFPFDSPQRDLESLKRAIANKLMFALLLAWQLRTW